MFKDNTKTTKVRTSKTSRSSAPSSTRTGIAYAPDWDSKWRQTPVLRNKPTVKRTPAKKPTVKKTPAKTTSRPRDSKGRFVKTVKK